VFDFHPCFLMLQFVQCEVLGGAILQQTFIVEYTVAYQMCSDCHRVEAKVTKHFG
jgi:NMD protein affecting ribosome stability and mRNA decay